MQLTNPESMTEEAQSYFRQRKDLKRKTVRTWALKEAARGFWELTAKTWAQKFCKRWYFEATRFRLDPTVRTAQLIARHLPNVMTYFANASVMPWRRV